MSETKKLDVEGLEFDSISGGREEKIGSVKPVALPNPEPTVRKLSGWNIPIGGESGWELTPLEDVSGEAFLQWVASVYPPAATSPYDPDYFDGPDNLANKQHFIVSIGKHYGDMLSRKGFSLSSVKQ